MMGRLKSTDTSFRKHMPQSLSGRQTATKLLLPQTAHRRPHELRRMQVIMTRHTAIGHRASVQHSVRRRVVWAAAIVATALLLALAGCGGARHQGQSNAGVTQQQTGKGSTSNSGSSNAATNSNPSAVSAVDSLDSQSQNDAQGLDNAANDASTNYTTQQGEAQP